MKLRCEGLKDFSWFCLSGCASRDLLMQVQSTIQSVLWNLINNCLIKVSL